MGHDGPIVLGISPCAARTVGPTEIKVGVLTHMGRGVFLRVIHAPIPRRQGSSTHNNTHGLQPRAIKFGMVTRLGEWNISEGSAMPNNTVHNPREEPQGSQNFKTPTTCTHAICSENQWLKSPWFKSANSDECWHAVCNSYCDLFVWLLISLSLFLCLSVLTAIFQVNLD